MNAENSRWLRESWQTTQNGVRLKRCKLEKTTYSKSIIYKYSTFHTCNLLIPVEYKISHVLLFICITCILYSHHLISLMMNCCLMNDLILFCRANTCGVCVG